METAEAPKPEHEVVMLLNFFHELAAQSAGGEIALPAVSAKKFLPECRSFGSNPPGTSELASWTPEIQGFDCTGDGNSHIVIKVLGAPKKEQT